MSALRLSNPRTGEIVLRDLGPASPAKTRATVGGHAITGYHADELRLLQERVARERRQREGWKEGEA